MYKRKPVEPGKNPKQKTDEIIAIKSLFDRVR